MHYANDNAAVKAIYDFTHGPQRGLFIGIVVAPVLVSLYFPVRDLYVATRSSDILAKQVEIRQQYNDELQKSVDKLLSEEGIKDAASEDLGPGCPARRELKCKARTTIRIRLEQEVVERQEGQRSCQGNRRSR